MHEAGLARAVAATLRTAGLLRPEHPPIRLIVSGGAHGASGFDAALLLHLQVAAPELDLTRLDIVHAPVAHHCLDCGSTFTDSGPDPCCPTCGGPGLAPAEPEHVDLEWREPAAGGPTERSATSSSGAEGRLARADRPRRR
jgi:hypothetical protein